MDNAEREARGALAQTLRESGLPRPLGRLSGRESAADPFVYRYNALAEITTERARFAWSPDLARAAVLYSDSAYARRVALEQNWPALGSVLFERGRAFRTLGELSGSIAALDSSWSYLRACADFRGPNRPWVFAQTREEFARLFLGRARLESRGRVAFLKRARTEVDSAVIVLAPTGLPPAARASLRSLDGELLIELGRAEHRPALLDSAESRLAEASRSFPATAFPRHAATVWVREALLSRARYEFDGKRERLGTAIEALDRARMLSESRSDRLLLDWAKGQRVATQRLAAVPR